MSERIPQDFIDDLIERADIGEVIGRKPYLDRIAKINKLYDEMISRESKFNDLYNEVVGQFNTNLETKYEAILNFVELAENKVLFTEMTGFG